MEQALNVMIDESLSDANLYRQVFEKIRKRFPQYKIAIIYVHATTEVVLSRVATRADSTGRHVPEKTVFESIERIEMKFESNYYKKGFL